MKKIFTTLLMMGAVLTGWATITPTWDDANKVLTVNFTPNTNNEGHSGPRELKEFRENYQQIFSHDNIKDYTVAGNVQKLVLTGAGFTNDDFGDGSAVENFVKQCCGQGNTLYLDLEGCTGIVSKVEYSDQGTKDPSKEFKYVYSNEIQRKNLTQRTYYAFEDGTTPSYNADQITTKTENEETTYWWNGYAEGYDGEHQVFPQVEWGYYAVEYYPGNYDPNSWVSVSLNDPRVGQEPNGNYYIEVLKSGTAFSFGVNNGSLGYHINGLTFPNSENFTAIPDKLCKQEYCPNLTSVVFDFPAPKTNHIVWIGESAFEGNNDGDAANRSHLANVTFPNSLEVINLTAFKGCTSFTAVNLDLPNLKKVDAAAFDMLNTEYNQLVSVTLPGQTNKTANTSLVFWGNQVFSSSHLVTLDFQYCEGIKHFAYDGKNYFGEAGASGGTISVQATFPWHVSMETLIFPPKLEYVSGCSEGVAPNCPALETVTFTGKGQYNDKCEITNPLVIGYNAFTLQGEGNTTRAIKNVTLSDNIVTIEQNAFTKTQIEEIHIPASVQTLGKEAFDICPNLTTVYFDDTKCPDCDNVEEMPVMTIEQDAFKNAQHITDVYIDNRTPIVCTNKAFAFDITFGQSNPNNPMASLHYPKGQEAHYTNLGHLLDDDTARDPGLFQAWLVDHFAYAQEPPSRNGWHEFVTSAPSTTGPDDPKPTDGVILCTFSDVKYAHLVPTGIKAFIVNGINPTSDGKSYELSLEPIQVIPAKTGVILYGEPNAIASDGTPYLSLPPVAFEVGEGQPLRRDHWNDLTKTQQHLKNYLLPTSDDDGNAIEIGPTDKEGKKVIWRNFAMNRYSTTETLSVVYPMDDISNDFVGFFRCKKGFSITPGRAYLHLSAVEDSEKGLVEEFTEATGGEIIVNMYSDYQMEYVLGDQNKTQYYGPSKGFWTHAIWANPAPNWGDRTAAFGNKPVPQFVYRGELDEEADGVVTLTVTSDNNQEGDIYTLQGVKVNNPAKGVYVRNGKKVIIK